MTHNEKVASYKAYLQTGDPQFIPSVYEKTAHVNEVQAWKDRWSKTAGCGLDHSKKKKKKKYASYNKEARAGHPANVALARALSPGILPGMNPGGSKVHVSHNGDFNHDIASFIEEGVDPGTRAYLRGDTGEKRASLPLAPIAAWKAREGKRDAEEDYQLRNSTPVKAGSKPSAGGKPSRWQNIWNNIKSKLKPKYNPARDKANPAYQGPGHQYFGPGQEITKASTPAQRPPPYPQPPTMPRPIGGDLYKEVTAADEQLQGSRSLSDILREFVSQR